MKNYFSERLGILKISIVNTYQTDTAYLGEKWASLASTTIYTLTYLLFLQILFANVHTIAGYTKNEMFLFTLIGQINFFILWILGSDNYRALIDDVNRGNLDLLLTKPIPALFYISLRRISLLTIIRDGFPNLVIVFLIHWQDLHFHGLNILFAIIVFICGQITINIFQFIFALPVFWFGQANELFNVSFDFVTEQVPFEGLTTWLKLLFTTFIPTFFSVSVCTSVILGKSNIFFLVGLSIAVAGVAMVIKNSLWKVALRAYSSASS